MKTEVKPIGVAKAVELAKPFILDNPVRPVLNCALVTDSYVIATNANILIRIKHMEAVTDSFLHAYSPKTPECHAGSYPPIDRLIPASFEAKTTFPINVQEFMNIHQTARIAAKEHKNKDIHLDHNKIKVSAIEEIINKKGKKEKVSVWKQIAFFHTLDTDTGVNVRYNCDYVLTMLKVFKKLKIKDISCYFYGPSRPMLFRDQDGLVEIIIMPIRMK